MKPQVGVSGVALLSAYRCVKTAARAIRRTWSCQSKCYRLLKVENPFTIKLYILLFHYVEVIVSMLFNLSVVMNLTVLVFLLLCIRICMVLYCAVLCCIVLYCVVLVHIV